MDNTSSQHTTKVNRWQTLKIVASLCAITGAFTGAFLGFTFYPDQTFVILPFLGNIWFGGSNLYRGLQIRKEARSKGIAIIPWYKQHNFILALAWGGSLVVQIIYRFVTLSGAIETIIAFLALLFLVCLVYGGVLYFRRDKSNSL